MGISFAFRVPLLMFGLFITLCGLSQPIQRWHGKAGIGIGGDAQMYYGGPVAQLGAGALIGGAISVDAEYAGHFAWKNAPAGDPSLEASWGQHSFSLLSTFYLGRSRFQGFYIGTGPTYQIRRAQSKDSWGSYIDNQEFFTWSLRFGQAIRTGKNQALLLEVHATGPRTYNDEFGSGAEILTQLSFNVLYRFGIGKTNTANSKR